MKGLKTLILISPFVFIMGSCVDPPNYPDEPVLEFISLEPSLINEGDPITISFSFTDGDGDLGNDDGNVNGFLIDSRAPGFPEAFNIPYIDAVGNIPDISGEISFTPSEPPCLNGLSSDTTTYSLYIVDRAGNKSNVIDCGEVIIICSP